MAQVFGLLGGFAGRKGIKKCDPKHVRVLQKCLKHANAKVWRAWPDALNALNALNATTRLSSVSSDPMMNFLPAVIRRVP